MITNVVITINEKKGTMEIILLGTTLGWVVRQDTLKKWHLN